MSECDLVGIMAIIKDAGADKLKSNESLANRTSRGRSKKTTDSAGALTDDRPKEVPHISWPVLRQGQRNL